MRFRLRLLCAVGLLVGSIPSLAQTPVGTEFTYQGQLKQAGLPVNQSADFRFRLYGAATGGNQVGPQLTENSHTVSAGLFTVALDFGVSAFTANQALWLEIDVRSPAGGGAFTTLAPRQPLTPTPFALNTRGINVSSAGNVGLGVEAQPGQRLYATALTGYEAAIRGEGEARGVLGIGTGDGTGVVGNAGGAGHGVFGDVSGTGAGVFGYARAISGANYGVRGTTESQDGFAGYFEGRGYFSGNLGLGTTSPGTNLHIRNTGPGASPASIRIDMTGASDGSPNSLLLGADGPLFGGIAYLDTARAGVAASTPLAFRTNSVERMRITADGNVGVGTASPAAKLHVAGTPGVDGIRFPDGTNQLSAARDEADYVIYSSGPTVSVRNGLTSQIEYQGTASECLQYAADHAAARHQIVVQGDLTLTSPVVITQSVVMEWNGLCVVSVPTGEPAFRIGAPGSLASGAQLFFQEVLAEPSDRSRDFMHIVNGQFTRVRVNQANSFRYIFYFPQGDGFSHPQNLFEYTVLANSTKAFYFPAPSGGGPAFGEGNQMMGGAIFGCQYGIHAENGADAGGMTAVGVIDNAGTNRDIWNEMQGGIGSIFLMSFTRYDYCKLHAFDYLLNAFGPADIGTAIELGRSAVVGNTPYIDFHFGTGSPQDFNARLINNQNDWLVAQVGRFHAAGTLSAGSKQFTIDHPLDPENKILNHACVESSDMLNLYNGIVITDIEGRAEITLPDWFESLNRDVRYQLTTVGQYAQSMVEREMEGNRFWIRTDKPAVKVSWQVTGIRKDRFAVARPCIVEEDKAPEQRGKYLHPEVFGKPSSAGAFALSAHEEVRPSEHRADERGGQRTH